MVVGVPFFPAPAEWPMPTGYKWKNYSDLWGDSFDVYRPMLDSVQTVGKNSQGVECTEWCYSPYLIREVTSMVIDSGYSGVMSWHFLSDVATVKPHSLLANMSSLIQYAELPLDKRTRTLDIVDSSAEALCGIAKWEFTVDSTDGVGTLGKFGWVTDSRGYTIFDREYNTFDKGVKGTINFPYSETPPSFSNAGVSLALDPSKLFPVLNLVSEDTIVVALNVDKDAPMLISLSYLGKQARASYLYTGKGILDTVRIPVNSFVADVKHNSKYVRNFTAANTGKISFSLPAPDTVSFDIQAVGVNSIDKEFVGISAPSVVKSSNIAFSMNQKRMMISTGVNSPSPVFVYTAQGKQVFRGEIRNSGSIDMSTVASGIYLVRIQTEQGSVTKSFVVK